MDNSIFAMLENGLQEFGQFIHWPFLFVFLAATWVINEVAKSGKAWKPKLSTFWRSFMVGAGMILLFWSMSGEHTVEEVLRYICSMWFAMFIMWDGLKKWTKLFKSNVTKKEGAGQDES